jgi:DNA topoisomerase IA
MKQVLIVESPNKIKKITDLLDKLIYERFLINHFSADEITGFYSP